MKLPSLLLSTLLLFSVTLFSQPVIFRTGAVQPKANITTRYLDSFSRTAPRFAGFAFGVLQFDQLPTESEKAKLQTAGVTLLDYLPHNAFTVSIKGSPSASFLQNLKAKALFPLTPQQKMQTDFARGRIPAWAVKKAGTVDIWLSFYKNLEADAVLKSISQAGIEVISTNHIVYRIVAVRIGLDRISEIAALPFVEFIQPAPPKDQQLNYNSRTVSRANVLNAQAASGGRGLNGEGIFVGHGDNADVQAHADFSGRLINRNASPFNAHGVHTAGTLAGAGIINELYRGYAPKATLISQSFSGIIEYAASYVRDYGMVITNNSYGNIVDCDYNGTYDLSSRILDQQALDHPNLLHVFSAGNSGNTCTLYPAGYRTVLGGYQSAKNIVTVGATNDSGQVAPFSSRGPLLDGRLKPEISAMGQNVTSSWPTNNYIANNGTSMAAPAVSGGLALLYQRYRQLHNGADPKNGLMKAILCNGAADRGVAGPDFQHGYGWMNLLRSVEMIEGNRYFSGSSANGSTSTHTVAVPANTAQLKVLLYWNDLPASVISTKNLVHDLDLEVTDPAGKVVLPLVLDTAVTALGNRAASGADHVNNIEQVIIPTPAAGNYTIRIKGTTVTTASQEYFVAYDPVPVQLTLTAPAGSDALVPGESAKISWDSEGLTGTGTLEFSSDGGATWSTIASGIDINRSLYTWTVTGITTQQALVRISKISSSKKSVSQPFTMIGQPVVSLAPVQCKDYLAINWTAVTGATDYEVMLLQGDEMKPVAITKETSYTFSGLVKDTAYFVSVRARINGKRGRRAVAVSHTPSGGNCAGSISDNDLKLEAMLGPHSGRKETATELSAVESIRVRIRNLDDVPVANFTISYAIDGQAPVTETVAGPVAAGSTYDHSFSTPANFSAAGKYWVNIYVTNTNDQNRANDTLHTVIKQIANAPLNLASPFVDNLETALPANYMKDTMGIEGVERYDYRVSEGAGRLRTYVNNDFANSGSKAFTLDASRYQPLGAQNYLYATFNLRNYSASTDDLRLDFMYQQYGQTSHPA
ncbi:MAG: S8 family serine peptidase, partial [Bacteroidota bacterium]|nr:S8 family serine peptidase [Bacteroidota bacterium]